MKRRKNSRFIPDGRCVYRLVCAAQAFHDTEFFCLPAGQSRQKPAKKGKGGEGGKHGEDSEPEAEKPEDILQKISDKGSQDDRKDKRCQGRSEGIKETFVYEHGVKLASRHADGLENGKFSLP